MLRSTAKLLLFERPKDDRERWHNDLISMRAGAQNGVVTAEGGLLDMVDALHRYCYGFKYLPWNSEEKTGPGRDGYAHAYVLDIAKGIIGLLAVETESKNGLICGKINDAVLTIMRQAGFTEEDLD